MTETSSFGTGKREGHDSSGFYNQDGLPSVKEAKKRPAQEPWTGSISQLFCKSAEHMTDVRDDSVGLMVTSPPYFAGKDYDEGSWDDYLNLLAQVFSETYRVLEPGGRAAINLANLGRTPYISLVSVVTSIMQGIGFFHRGEIIWVKAKGASGSCAWGSWMSASNPCLRDLHEYILVFSKERFARARKGRSTISREDFMRDTLSVWTFPPESAKRIGHPAPFPVELPRRLINLYSYVDDLVLDPFMGSGTTAVACQITGRKYVGYEKDEQYLAKARERLGLQ